jgi:nucleoid DNA-binding protein
MDKTKELVIKELSEKYKLPEEVILNMVDSQGSFVIEALKEFKETKNYKVILLPKFGKFAPSYRKIKMYEINKNNKSLLEIPNQAHE